MGALDEGTEPDARFTFANERTFLAWNRTALALVVTGVAATQFLPELRVDWGRQALGVPVIALGAVVAIVSFFEWRQRQRAMRLGDPLPRSNIVTVLTVGITIVAAIALFLVTFET